MLFRSFISVLAALGVTLWITIPPASKEAQNFIASVPDFYSETRASFETWTQQHAAGLPEGLRQRLQDSFQNAGDFLIDQAQGAVLNIISTITNALSIMLGLVIIPTFLYYLLKDRELLAEGLSSSFPSAIRPHAVNVLAIVTRVMGAYVRAQLAVGVVAGIGIFLGLFFLGIRFPVLLALIAVFTEMVPVIGPWIAGITGVLVTLVTSPEKVDWVVLVYVGVRVLEDALLIPQIEGHALRVHPIIVLIAIVVGGKLAGLWGVILGPPLAAIAVEAVKYFYQEWNREVPPSLAEAQGDIEEEEVRPALVHADDDGC